MQILCSPHFTLFDFTCLHLTPCTQPAQLPGTTSLRLVLGKPTANSSFLSNFHADLQFFTCKFSNANFSSPEILWSTLTVCLTGINGIGGISGKPEHLCVCGLFYRHCANSKLPSVCSGGLTPEHIGLTGKLS